MATSVDVANFALGHLGEDRITSLTEASEAARVMNTWFDHARRAALRLGNWTSASKRVSIAADPTAPVYGYDRRFALPGDFIRLIKVQNAGPGLEAVVEDGYILTNLDAPISIKYVYDKTDVSGLDEDLIEVMALMLASYGAMRLTQSRLRKDELVAEAKAQAAQAKNVDTSGVAPVPLAGGSWMTSREGGRDPSKWYGG